MRPEDIIDRDTLQRWLQSRDRAVIVSIAHRAAMRAVPLWVAGKHTRKLDWSLIRLLRRLLTSGVAVLHASPEVKKAAAATVSATTSVSAATTATHATANAAYAAATAATAAATAATANAANAAIGNAAYAVTYAAYAAGGVGSALWAEIRTDAAAVASGKMLIGRPLWGTFPPEKFIEADHKTGTRWSADPALWSFWSRWWEGAKQGRPLNWNLQRDIALIPDEDWEKGPAHVAGLIAGIEERYQSEPAEIDVQLQQMPPSPPQVRTAFATAVWQNREALPATLDAILGYAALEIERLQTRNYRDEDDRAESLRQIGVLLRLHDAVSRLAPMLITDKPMTEVESIVPEKLSRVVVKAFQDWPRKNVDDLADSVYRFALTGVASTGLVMLGVSMPVAIAIGGAFFGGKKLTDAIKAGADSKSLS